MVGTIRSSTGTRRGSDIVASAVSLLAAFVVGSCAVSGPMDPPETAQQPRDELAEPAEMSKQRPAATIASTAAKGPAARRTAPSGQKSLTKAPRSDGGRAGPAGAASDSGKAAAWKTVLRLSDASGDFGLTGGPDYADLTGLRIDDDGGRVRLTVSVAGAVRERLDDGEVVGIGIDIYRSSRQESDYQVFLDGGSHGWRAFLQTPRGFVRFPGTFAIDGGRSMIVEIPWSDLGGRKSGRVAAFADWSNGSGALSSTSHDGIPDAGARRFALD